MEFGFKGPGDEMPQRGPVAKPRRGSESRAPQKLKHFWATVCKTVRPTLSHGCSVCLSVCDVGVLWPDGWPHCIKCISALQFSTDVCCGQTAGLIKMPLGRQVGLGPGHIVLDVDSAPPKRGTASQFSAYVHCDQTVAHLSCCRALVVTDTSYRATTKRRVCV